MGNSCRCCQVEVPTLSQSPSLGTALCFIPGQQVEYTCLQVGQLCNKDTGGWNQCFSVAPTNLTSEMKSPLCRKESAKPYGFLEDNFLPKEIWEVWNKEVPLINNKNTL